MDVNFYVNKAIREICCCRFLLDIELLLTKISYFEFFFLLFVFILFQHYDMYVMRLNDVFINIPTRFLDYYVLKWEKSYSYLRNGIFYFRRKSEREEIVFLPVIITTESPDLFPISIIALK
jgi:hypothetical protein